VGRARARKISAQLVEDEDYQLRYERVAEIDVAKAKADVCTRLPPAREGGLRVQLVNSRHARQLAGRPKIDQKDAQWIVRLAEMGLLRPSFVPPPEIRALRDLTRQADAGPRPDEGVAAAGEAAGGRAGQAVVRGALHVQGQDGP
jgi:hypothetical protein